MTYRDLLPIDPHSMYLADSAAGERMLNGVWTVSTTVRFVRNSTGQQLHHDDRFLVDDDGVIRNRLKSGARIEDFKVSYGFTGSYNGPSVPDGCYFFACPFQNHVARTA